MMMMMMLMMTNPISWIKTSPQTTGSSSISHEARPCHAASHQEAQHRDQVKKIYSNSSIMLLSHYVFILSSSYS